MTLPLLYTFRRCPYAIRARMGLAYSSISFEIREVLLKDKPQEMLQISPKGTVPVLQLVDQSILDESLEILDWALEQNDSEGWKAFAAEELVVMKQLIEENDTSFKKNLDHYKYGEQPQIEYRQRGEVFLKQLEERLEKAIFLFGNKVSFADIAIFPFIRQFAQVEDSWFQQSPYPQLKRWLNFHLKSPLFLSVMKKYQPWKSSDSQIFFERSS